MQTKGRKGGGGERDALAAFHLLDAATTAMLAEMETILGGPLRGADEVTADEIMRKLLHESADRVFDVVRMKQRIVARASEAASQSDTPDDGSAAAKVFSFTQALAERKRTASTR